LTGTDSEPVTAEPVPIAGQNGSGPHPVVDSPADTDSGSGELEPESELDPDPLRGLEVANVEPGADRPNIEPAEMTAPATTKYAVTIKSNLLSWDYDNLAACGISRELAQQAQLHRVDSREGADIVGQNDSRNYAGLVFPNILPGETRPREYRLRRDNPEIEVKYDDAGNEISKKAKDKYYSPPGRGNLLYLVPGTPAEHLDDARMPILLVEGEKKCLALYALAHHGGIEQPRFQPVAVPGVWCFRGTIGKKPGANGARCDEKGIIHDFARIALKGREVTILYDTNVRDNSGVQAARRELTTALRRRGATVSWFAWPDDTPAGVNGIDDLIGLWGPEKVLLTIEQRTYEPTNAKAPLSPTGFAVTDAGVFYTELSDPDAKPVLVCSKLEVTALTRSESGDNWGRQLRWSDPEGRQHQRNMPMAELAGDGTDYRRALLDGGLTINPGRNSRDLLTTYIQLAKPERRVLCTDRSGWNGDVFVLPDITIGPILVEEVVFQREISTPHYFNTSGTTKEWRENVGGLCSGNSRLILAASCSFAGPLLPIVGAESGGVHFYGPSSVGKTTALIVGGSVCGGGGRSGFVQSWKSTTNSLEATAEMHNHLCLPLDELSQIDPREAPEACYMLGNGGGKNRMTKNITPRRSAKWELIYMSSGELTLSDHAASAGKRTRAGAEVRLLNILADAGERLGLFEDLHGAESPDAFARQLKGAALRFYGAPLRAYLEFITQNMAAAESAIRNFQDDFIRSHVPEGASGEVFRAAQRFALIAAAGELATSAGITGWTEGEAIEAVARCFKSWLAGRGTTGAGDAESAIRQVRRFLEAHGASRFQVIRPGATDSSTENQIVVNRAGFRQQTPDGETEFLVLPETFKADVCNGLDYRMVARTLNERGFLEWQPPHLTKRVRLPGGLGLANVFCIKGSILEG
jgi:uncharacterized protein (DUF927 family)